MPQSSDSMGAYTINKQRNCPLQTTSGVGGRGRKRKVRFALDEDDHILPDSTDGSLSTDARKGNRTQPNSFDQYRRGLAGERLQHLLHSGQQGPSTLTHRYLPTDLSQPPSDGRLLSYGNHNDTYGAHNVAQSLSPSGPVLTVAPTDFHGSHCAEDLPRSQAMQRRLHNQDPAKQFYPQNANNSTPETWPMGTYLPNLPAPMQLPELGSRGSPGKRKDSSSKPPSIAQGVHLTMGEVGPGRPRLEGPHCPEAQKWGGSSYGQFQVFQSRQGMPHSTAMRCTGSFGVKT